MGNGGPGMWFGGPLCWILLIVVLLFLIPWAIRQMGGSSTTGTGGAGSGKALEILKERYARGEIGQDEFERKRAELEE